MSNDQLSPTSYLVLGLLAREGPSSPYDLKRLVTSTVGHFWTFPHALLYAEPPRLVRRGLATETQEEKGRRRRVFTISEAGITALQAWLGRPSRQPTELRDRGLLQLFFADLGTADAQHTIALEQLAVHRAKLAGYELDATREGRASGRGVASRTVEHWRSRTLQMGVLYERAAVDFWASVVAEAPASATALERVDDAEGPSPVVAFAEPT
jgi:PadR family transcriptional regulator AphA